VQVNDKEVILSRFELSDGRSAIRFLVFWRDRFRCVYCNEPLTPGNCNIDHAVPASDKGPYDFDNLVASCVPCNRDKHGKTPSEEELKKVIGRTEINSDEFFLITGIRIPPVKKHMTLNERVAYRNPPTCKCSSTMVLKFSVQNRDFFWGCPKYPDCREAGQGKPISDEVRDILKTYYPDDFVPRPPWA
jgi:hypothetical protein